MKILLVRHGESAANADKLLHKTHADHDLPLSPLGEGQAIAAGKAINAYLNENLKPLDPGFGKSHKVRVWNSPYRRTRQTTRGIMSQIESAMNGDLPLFTLDNRENNRLCEQQFGLFDGIDDDDRINVYPDEGAHYQKCVDFGGQYWARMPLGESRFDVANRVYQMFGTMHRDAEKHGIDTVIVVCHGVTLRAFVHEWLHLSPEWFDAEKNPDNCWVRLLDNVDGINTDLGYIFTGEGDEENWPKQKKPVIGSPCLSQCRRKDGTCPTCKRTIDEIKNWSTMSTKERSDVFIDLTMRD